jgi:uncharacterized protein (DUF885 family)
MIPMAGGTFSGPPERTHPKQLIWQGALLFLVIPALAACDLPGASAGQDEAGVHLAQLFEEWSEASTQLNSNGAIGRGDRRFDDRFVVTITEEYRAASRALNEEYLERLRRIDRSALSESDRISFDMFQEQRRIAIEADEIGWTRAQALLPVTQFFSLQSSIANQGSGAGSIPFRTPSDYDNWLKRLEGWYEWVDVAIANMRIGMEEGVVQPTVVVERTLPQLAAHVVVDVEASLFWRPVENIPDGFSDEDRERIRGEYTEAVRERIVPSYQRLHDFLRDEYLPRTRSTVGIGDLPGGGEWYDFLGRFYTSTDTPVAEIHEIGLREVDRILGEMREVMDEVGFQGTVQEFFTWLREEPRFYFGSRQDLLDGYEALREVVESRADRIFHPDTRPEAAYEIHPIAEFEEQSQAGAYYSRPSPDGTRPGRFFVNTYDRRARPSYSMTALFLHEAIPGHHFQIGVQQENEDLPDFRRFGGSTVFVEGWALYAETLGHEMGLYDDPYQRFGQLTAEIWRANRLVIDTGIHLHGWTREEGIDQMVRTTSMGMSDIVAEVERYIAMPGQALAFKMGQLKILELRERARDALGDAFDIRDFHEVVIGEGAMPLHLLEARVEAWIGDRGGG